MPQRLGRSLSQILNDPPSRRNPLLDSLGKVNSSAIVNISWNPLERVNLLDIYEGEINGTLTIEFAKRGTYEYDDVPAGVFLALRGSSSVGGYFNSRIRNQFNYRRVG